MKEDHVTRLMESNSGNFVYLVRQRQRVPGLAVGRDDTSLEVLGNISREVV